MAQSIILNTKINIFTFDSGKLELGDMQFRVCSIPKLEIKNMILLCYYCRQIHFSMILKCYFSFTFRQLQRIKRQALSSMVL
jgi:hypothetical protein